jgi:hypothetical protein
MHRCINKQNYNPTPIFSFDIQLYFWEFHFGKFPVPTYYFRAFYCELFLVCALKKTPTNCWYKYLLPVLYKKNNVTVTSTADFSVMGILKTIYFFLLSHCTVVAHC